MKSIFKYGMNLICKAKKNTGLHNSVTISGEWTATCFDKHGLVKWRENWFNIVVDEGLNESLNVTLGGQSQSATWYLGLLDGASPTVAASDTMASNGWTENVAISNAVRPTWASNAPVSGEVITNPSAAVFNIDTNSQTVGGAFLTSANDIGGATGKLFAAGTFAAKSLDDGDTLEITAQFTAS